MLTERFLSKVTKLPSGCWEWNAAVTHNGYGRFKTGGKTRVAHRVSFEAVNGPVPAGLQLDHVCRNTRCVNPDHLRAVTPRENVLAGNTVTAANANRAECVRGHPLSGDNLFLKKNGSRHCRICHNERGRSGRQTAEYRARHAARERSRRLRLKLERTAAMVGHRQGDVLVIPAKSIPAKSTPVPRGPDGSVTLAEGESTGHRHALYGGRVKMFLADEGYGGGTYIDVPKGGDALKHEEHTAHQIPAGPREVIRQVEYDLQDGARQVAD